MLLLSRKSGESVRIGEEITVTVVESRGKRVRLAIDAPSDHEILRGELVERHRQWDDSPANIESGQLELALV